MKRVLGEGGGLEEGLIVLMTLKDDEDCWKDFKDEESSGRIERSTFLVLFIVSACMFVWVSAC